MCTILRELYILNYKNIKEAQLTFSDKLNCMVGLNGQGKTNLLDAIYLLSFTKSAFTPLDSQNITHQCDIAMVQGQYMHNNQILNVTCGLKKGQKKQFRCGDKDYKRLIDHIGLIPTVMISPQDTMLINDGSDERRKFVDSVISQYNKPYLEHLTEYNALIKQRNALLKILGEQTHTDQSMLDVYDLQLVPHAEIIYQERTAFITQFIPIFQQIYSQLSDNTEKVGLQYVSQLQTRQLDKALTETRERDIILGWTSQGVHKDDIEMTLEQYPLKHVGSQGQQKTYLIAMKLAQAIFLGKPILLLDDIGDRLDQQRVERIIQLVSTDRFGQIFISDTHRNHLPLLLKGKEKEACIYNVTDGVFTPEQ